MIVDLKKVQPAFAESLALHANNQKIACELEDGFPHPYTLKHARMFLSAHLEDDESRFLCRCILVDDEPAGMISVTFRGDIYRCDAELGYWLGEKFWRKGVMRTAVNAVCDHLFAERDLVRISAKAFADNHACRILLEKCGFVLEGIQKQAAIKENVYRDLALYARFRPEQESVTE